MDFVFNQWYAAAWSENLGDKPVGLRILGIPIVLFRTADEGVAVLHDLCPHRFAPLHLGAVVDGDRLRCGYHGLEFSAAGDCLRNPHGAGRTPHAAKVKSYSASERNGIVWVWLGDRPADQSLIPDFGLLEDPRTIRAGAPLTIVMKANYQLIVNNLLDLSHANILHEDGLGNAAMNCAEIVVEDHGAGFVVRRLSRNIFPPRAIQLLCDSGENSVDVWVDMYVSGVAALLNDFGAAEAGLGRDGGTRLFGLNLVTPIDEESSLYLVRGVIVDPPPRSLQESIAAGEELSQIADWAFNMQDKVMLEAQQLAIGDKANDTSRAALFDIDVGPVRYERHLNALRERDRNAGGQP